MAPDKGRGRDRDFEVHGGTNTMARFLARSSMIDDLAKAWPRPAAGQMPDLFARDAPPPGPFPRPGRRAAHHTRPRGLLKNWEFDLDPAD